MNFIIYINFIFYKKFQKITKKTGTKTKTNKTKIFNFINLNLLFINSKKIMKIIMKIIMKYTKKKKRGKKRTFFKKKINKLFFFLYFKL